MNNVEIIKNMFTPVVVVCFLYGFFLSSSRVVLFNIQGRNSSLKNECSETYKKDVRKFMRKIFYSYQVHMFKTYHFKEVTR